MSEIVSERLAFNTNTMDQGIFIHMILVCPSIDLFCFNSHILVKLRSVWFKTGVPNPQGVTHYRALNPLELGCRSGGQAAHTSLLALAVDGHGRPLLTQMELRIYACLQLVWNHPPPLPRSANPERLRNSDLRNRIYF